MNRILLVVVLAAALILPTAGKAQGSGPATQANTAAGNAQNGKNLYLQYGCYACHGYNGQTGNGTRLVPMRLNASGFTAYIRNPSRMPPYTAKVVPDAQAADLWAYINTLKDSPQAKDIPLLNQILNEK